MVLSLRVAPLLPRVPPALLQQRLRLRLVLPGHRLGPDCTAPSLSSHTRKGTFYCLVSTLLYLRFVAWDFSFIYRRTEPIQACQALSKLRPNQSPSTSALKPSQGRKSWEPTRNTTAHHAELTSWLSRNCKSGDFHLSWYTVFLFAVCA